MKQLARHPGWDVDADMVHACEAAVCLQDLELVAGLSVWIDQLCAELATLPPAHCGV